MRKYDLSCGGGSNILVLVVGFLLVLPFIGFYWAFNGDKDWKRVVGIIFLVVYFIGLLCK